LSSIDSLISHFIDDVIRLIREAKVEDLLDLVAAAPRPVPPLVESEPERVEPASQDDPHDEPAPSRRTPITRLAPVRRIGRRPHAEPPTVEEITDPASLLAIAPEAPSSAAPPPPPTLPTLLADPVDDLDVPPPSSSQSSRVLVRLNSNETLARSTNAGIVIRRRKA
jgi:hypothetical protein